MRINDIRWVVALLAPSPALAGTIHVNVTAAPGGDGSTWATALQSLDDALDVAGSGDEVHVAGGTYVPTRRSNPRDFRSAAFTLVDGVTIRGGYAGSGAAPEVRDHERHPTRLSGDILDNDDPAFSNYFDNTYEVVRGANITADLDGLTLTGASDAHNYGGVALRVSDATMTVSNCRLVRNATRMIEVTGQIGLTLLDCDISENRLELAGIHDRSDGGFVRLRRCRFADNFGEYAAAFLVIDRADVTLVDVTVVRNFSNPPMIAAAGNLAMTNCFFRDNVSGPGPAASLIIVPSLGSMNMTNTVFSSNDLAGSGSAVLATGTVQATNCTFGNNYGGCIRLKGGMATIANSILWNPFGPELDGGGLFGGVFVTHSIVPGGFPGIGNVGFDPLFVQPGADDLRLSLGSPAHEAGANDLLPQDVHDLDGDGNTREPLPHDLLGAPRISGAADPNDRRPIVDMGAYEGVFPALPPADVDDDVDAGETVFLTPQGAFTFVLPTEAASAILLNTSDDNNATALLAQIDDDIAPGAAGFTELTSVLDLDTTLSNGVYRATLYIPIDTEIVGAANPLELDMTMLDNATGNWALAVAGNVSRAAAADGPVGRRVAMLGPGPFGTTQGLGDYGVYWDPTIERGFVWANVDHATSFGVGLKTCRTDCAPLLGDQHTDIDDLIAVLLAWSSGADGGVCDVNRDNIVDLADLLGVIEAWGACSAP